MSVRKIVPIEQAVWDVAPAPEWVVEHAPDWEYKAPQGDEAAVAILLQDEQHLVATHASYRRYVRHLLTHGAVQALSQTSIDFDPAAFKLWIHELAVWRRDAQGMWQKRSHARREDFLLRQREEQLEQQMLHGRVSVVALLEDVRVGDAIEIASTLEPRDPLPGWRFTAMYAWAPLAPNARMYFSLQLDPAQPLRWRCHVPPHGALQPVEAATPERVTWHLDRPALLELEPNAPGSDWPFALLEISGWERWGDVARFVANLWKDAYADGAETVAAEAARLRVENDAAATARAVIRFVQEEVRYLAVDFGHGGGVLPNGAGTVLRRRFGDCKDKAVLLTAMLRAVGIEAAPVLVAPNWRSAVSRVQPSTSAFSHAIVAVTVGEMRRFVDPTTVGQGGDFEHLVEPAYGFGLEVREETEELVALPEAKRTTFTVTEVFNLATDGAGTVETTMRATGSLADSVRAGVLQQGLSAAVKGGATRLQNSFPALQPQLDTATVDDQFATNEIKIAATHALPTWGRPGERPPPQFTYGAHGLFLVIEAVAPMPVRKQPWELPYPVHVHHRVVVRGPGVQRVETERFRHNGPGFRYSCDVTCMKRQVAFDYQWETTQPEIAPADWPRYLRDREKALERAGANVPVALGSGVSRFGRAVTGGGVRTERAPVALGVGLSIGFMVLLAVIRLFVSGTRTTAPEVSSFPSSFQSEIGEPVPSHKMMWSAAKTALERGEYAIAAEKLAAVLPHYRMDAPFHLARAEAFIGTRQLTHAREAIKEARRFAADEADADAIEAHLCEWLGDLPAARELAERAYALKSGEVAQRLRMGVIAARSGDEARARELLEGILRQRPQHTQAALQYALWLYYRGETQRADSIINAATASGAQPRTSATEGTLSRYFAATGRLSEAVQPARRGTEWSPEEGTAVFRFVMSLVRASRKAEATMQTRDMVRRFPDLPLSWAAAAAISAANGATSADDAERAFQRWMQLAPGEPMALSEYGLHLLRTNRARDAKDHLAGATNQYPRSGFLWGSYAVVLDALGETRDAAEAKEKADRLLPDRALAALLY